MTSTPPARPSVHEVRDGETGRQGDGEMRGREATDRSPSPRLPVSPSLHRLPIGAGYVLGALLGAGLFLLAYWVLVLDASLSFLVGWAGAAAIVWWLTRDERAAFLSPT